MKILMVLTSHDQLGNTGARPDFGLRNLPLLTLFSKMRVWNSPSLRRKADSRRSIRKAISRKIKRRR